jgi:hypothetical protein
MKFLIENWRKFMTEDEAAYFPWLEELEQKGGEALLGDNFDQIGSGAFRVVFRPKGDNDHIVKLIKNPRDGWMNQVESKTGNTYPSLFPKTYAHADDWEWIAQESVDVIGFRDEDKLRKMLMTTFPTLYLAFGGVTYKGQALWDLWDRIANSALNPYLPIHDKIKNLGLIEEPAYVELTKAMSDFRMDPDDLRGGNIGINDKGELRILDASIFQKPQGL